MAASMLTGVSRSEAGCLQCEQCRADIENCVWTSRKKEVLEACTCRIIRCKPSYSTLFNCRRCFKWAG